MLKVLVIGIDGGTWDVALPLIRDNKLPTFRIQRGDAEFSQAEALSPN